MSYIDVTGKTEEEAVAKALAQLNLDRDDVSVEILERAKSGFLGLGSSPAKVRVTYGEEEEPAKSEEQKPAPAAPAKAAEKPVQKPASQTEKPKIAEPEKMPEVRPAFRQEPVVSAPPADLGEEVDDEKAQEIKKFLSGLLQQMESDAVAHVYLPEKGRYKVVLEGANLGQLIGRRGETLDAIQQLTSYSVNRGNGPRIRVQLDAENYRERREQSLEHLAQKVAGKVVKYRRNVTLEPMNAYERHVIHTALQDAKNVTTYSTGVEPNRRVIVAFDRDKN